MLENENKILEKNYLKNVRNSRDDRRKILENKNKILEKTIIEKSQKFDMILEKC